MKNYTLIIILLLLSAKLSAQESIVPTIQLVESPNPCGSFEDRRITVLVDIGKVLPSHQLYGFEFGIGIDTSKIVFDNLIKQTTMLEYFGEYVTVQSQGNLITGGGGLLQGGPVAGDRPLFAVSFRLKEETFEETYIRLDYLYMYEEYQNTIDLNIDDTLKIDHNISQSSLSELSISIKDRLQFDSTKISEVDLSFESSKIERLNYLLINYELDSSLYLLKDAYSENWDIEINDNTIEIVKINDTDNLDISLVLEQKTDSLDSEMLFNVEDVNISSCLSTNDSKKIQLKAFVETIASVEELIKINEIIVDDNTILNKKNKSIKVYDLLGNVKYSGKNHYIHLNSGFYIIIHNEKYYKIIIN